MLTVVSRSGWYPCVRVLPFQRALVLADTLERAGNRVVVLRHGRVVRVREAGPCDDRPTLPP